MTVHQLTTSDTLHSLAVAYYGDAGQWRAIAQANDLRPPYISDDPLLQYGALLATLTLDLPAAPGQTQITLASSSPLLRPGMRLVFTRRQADGAQIIEAATLASSSGRLAALQEPLTQPHPAQTTIRVHPPPLAVAGRVARPGETLLIPGGSTSERSANDRYGRDLAVDPEAGILFTPEGDIATVGGVANLQQQMRHRLIVSPGGLLRHPDYGNGAQAYVGRESTAAIRALMQSQLATSALDDPRIVSVEQVVITASGTTVTASARLIAASDIVDLSVRL